MLKSKVSFIGTTLPDTYKLSPKTGIEAPTPDKGPVTTAGGSIMDAFLVTFEVETTPEPVSGITVLFVVVTPS